MKYVATIIALLTLILVSCDNEDMSSVGTENSFSTFRITSSQGKSVETDIDDFNPPAQGSFGYSFILLKADAEKLGLEKELFLDSLVMEHFKENDRVDRYTFYESTVIDYDLYGTTVIVTIRSKYCSTVSGVSLNPGPAPGAKPITSNSTNTGWVYRHKAKIGERGIAIELNDFSVEMNNGTFKLHILNNDSSFRKIEKLIEKQGKYKELILVLPVKKTVEYTEYKLWAPSLSRNNLDQYDELVFKTNDIIQLLGK